MAGPDIPFGGIRVAMDTDMCYWAAVSAPPASSSSVWKKRPPEHTGTTDGRRLLLLLLLLLGEARRLIPLKAHALQLGRHRHRVQDHRAVGRSGHHGLLAAPHTTPFHHHLERVLRGQGLGPPRPIRVSLLLTATLLLLLLAVRLTLPAGARS